jgi:hypothetical protein
MIICDVCGKDLTEEIVDRSTILMGALCASCWTDKNDEYYKAVIRDFYSPLSLSAKSLLIDGIGRAERTLTNGFCQPFEIFQSQLSQFSFMSASTVKKHLQMLKTCNWIDFKKGNTYKGAYIRRLTINERKLIK